MVLIICIANNNLFVVFLNILVVFAHELAHAIIKFLLCERCVEDGHTIVDRFLLASTKGKLKIIALVGNPTHQDFLDEVIHDCRCKE
jgi:hypothetical protein